LLVTLPVSVLVILMAWAPIAAEGKLATVTLRRSWVEDRTVTPEVVMPEVPKLAPPESPNWTAMPFWKPVPVMVIPMLVAPWPREVGLVVVKVGEAWTVKAKVAWPSSGFVTMMLWL